MHFFTGVTADAVRETLAASLTRPQHASSTSSASQTSRASCPSRTPASLRGLAVLAAVSAAALVLAGCSTGSADGSSPDTSLESLSGAAQAEAFSALYDQKIKWVECDESDGLDDYTADELESMGYDLRELACADVTAPFDWEDSTDTETIKVAVVHLPATGGEPVGTLLGNPGGPGATGVDFMLGMALSPGFEDVAASYDLLGFDPRGIGRSTPIDCDGGGSDLPAVQLGTCIADNPLTHTMGTSQVARDMEMLRHLMGDDVLNYVGYSYGTMLGATYATLFPERVGRMVLDSAENAEWASPIHFFDQSVAVSRASVALATSCRTDYADDVEVCPFVDEDSLIKVLDQLDAEPLKPRAGSTVDGIALDSVEIDGNVMGSYLTNALYESHFERGRTLETIALALFGDEDAINEIAAEFVDTGEGIDMTMTVVSCHSFPIEPDIPGLLEHIEETGMPRMLGGPEITDETIAPFTDLSCYALPESGLDLTTEFSAKGANEILVIGITGDHATPFQYAVELTEELGNAVLLTLDGQGHAASYSDRSSCVDNAVNGYLLEGDLPKEGTVCADD